jgi:hypothetical protein
MKLWLEKKKDGMCKMDISESYWGKEQMGRMAAPEKVLRVVGQVQGRLGLQRGASAFLLAQ